MRINCLDHGFVELRNIAGPTRRAESLFDADDIDPANAARMSFDNMDANRLRDDDLKLCDYLMRNWHTSPFEMVQVWLEMKMPIFLARQFIRHRTSSVNESSARYITLPEEWYIPEVVGGKATSNKQGQDDNLDLVTQKRFKHALNLNCLNSYQSYIAFIQEGVAPEHARLFLHVNHYTHWLWRQDLHNLMHLMSLRLHNHAQIEARVYAQAIYDLIVQVLPESMRLFDEYRRKV